MNTLMRDVQFGIRMLRKQPGFTAVAVAVLALGIGANTAVFSLVNAFVLKPLRIEKADELVGLYSREHEEAGFLSRLLVSGLLRSAREQHGVRQPDGAQPGPGRRR